MGRLEILAQINVVNKEIAELESRKKEYEYMNRRLEEAVDSLRLAKNYVGITYNGLIQNYSSAVATKKSGKLQKNSDEIDEIINKINGVYLIDVRLKINDLNSQISIRTGKIKRLSRELNQMTT